MFDGVAQSHVKGDMRSDDEENLLSKARDLSCLPPRASPKKFFGACDHLAKLNEVIDGKCLGVASCNVRGLYSPPLIPSGFPGNPLGMIIRECIT